MGLVNELQESAEQDDVLIVLRKAKRLASKLGLKTQSHWADMEIKGYSEEDDVPKYRMITSYYACRLDNAYANGHIGNGLYVFYGIPVVKSRFVRSISETLSIIKKIDEMEHGYCVGMSAEDIRRVMDEYLPSFIGNILFVMRMDTDEIKAIPERIKDTVLDWACALEEAGVTGEGKTFDEDDKKKASNVTFNISGSVVGQISDSGTNYLGDTGNGEV